jgi:hypothetical protein
VPETVPEIMTVHLIDLADPMFEEELEAAHESDIERINAARACRVAELTIQKLREEILHAQNEINSWQHTPLDEISPPSFVERTIPILAGAMLFFSAFSANKHKTRSIEVGLLGPILLGFYVAMRAKRRDRAQARVHEIVMRWQEDLQERQQLLEKQTDSYS